MQQEESQRASFGIGDETMKTIETERLLLRPFEERDLDQIYSILSHPDIWKHDPGRPRTFEETRSLMMLSSDGYQTVRLGRLATIDKATDRLIGYCGLQLLLLEHGMFKSPEVELFFALDRERWGRGYMTEAAQAVINYGFQELSLRRIVSTAARENEGSIKVMRRIGMQTISDPFEPDWVVGFIDNPASEALELTPLLSVMR